MAGAQQTNGNGGKWLQWLPSAAAALAILLAIGSYFKQSGASDSTVEGMRAEQQLHSQHIAQLSRNQQLLQIEQASSEKDNCQQFAKTETQFGTVETVINDMRVDDLRVRAGFWEKIYGQIYSPAFYEIKIPHEIVPCK